MILLSVLLVALIFNPRQPPIVPPSVPPSVTLPPLAPLPPPTAPLPRPPLLPAPTPPPVPDVSLSCGCFKWDPPEGLQVAMYELSASTDQIVADPDEVRAPVHGTRQEVSCADLQLSTDGRYWVAVRAVTDTGERTEYSNQVCIEVRTRRVFACDETFMKGATCDGLTGSSF